MNEVIYFKTKMFDLSKEEENPYNPIYGKSLLIWLKDKLKDELEITEPGPEDWGWYSELSWEGRNYLIGSSAHFSEGDDPAEEVEWVFQVHKDRSFREKIFGREKMNKDDSCFNFFKGVFEKESNLVDVEVE
ncbi:hypothetical protein [Aliikangiella sp. IMCC44359]|uniref:hypothetical protein n=1 Tax=Aliikangiella sp. IMCC44359 TaxID=3459125 RepID=UPI00403AD51C